MASVRPGRSLDPSSTADELFAEDATIAELAVTEVGRETRGAATVRDITFAGSRGPAVPAYVVTPAAESSRAGVLFLHWRGEFDSNRDEFLEEAVALAADGVESILIDQVFPFAELATGLEHDRVEIGLQVRDARRALAILAAEVGSGPLAVVGHDFGGMYAAILRGLEPGLAGVVVMAATGAWADWFIDFVNVVPTSEAPVYRAGLEDVDPITWVAKPADSRILFQFASFDGFVPLGKAEAFTAAAGEDAEARRYEPGHALNDAARTERDAWLLEQLGVD